MSSRRLRSAAPLDQEFATPHTQRSSRISQDHVSQSAQSSSRQQAMDTNTRSRSRKGKRKQLSDDSKSASIKRATNGSGVLAVGASEPRSNLTSSNPTMKKRKQPPDGSQSPGSSKRATTGSGISEPRSNDPTSSNPQPKYFRISGVPSSWNENDLFDALYSIDPCLTRQDYRPSLYPACFSSSQTALLNLDPCTENLHGRAHLQVSESASKTAALLKIDSQFYSLTPLNVPVGEAVADVIAVTGLAGHAFESWRNRETNQMWLKDLLPHDVQNIRIMSYGYDSSLLGDGKADNRLLDHQRLFIQDSENARSSVKTNRPIIFIGHSLGGILILQALIECKRNREHTHILDAMHSIIFFGTPHQGMRTYDLEEMVDAESSGYETSRHNLLRQLREGSEFLENQKEDLSYIWEEYKPKIISFYESVQTPTIKMPGLDSYVGDGKESEMVSRFSAQLYIPTEKRVPVEENHSNMVKFASAEDRTYRTVVRYVKGWVDSIIESYAVAIKIENLQKSQEYIDCRKSLKPSDYKSYRNDLLLRRHENTCTWILDDQRYRTWNEKDGQAILWISGGPGFGKSVLSSFLTKEIPRGKTNQLYMTYFFCDDKDERLRTAHAILVNLLTQLLEQVPDVIMHFLAEPEYTTYKEKTAWNYGMLWRVFERIMNDTDRGKVYILIDALDECEEQSCTKLLKQLQLLLREATTAIRPIKIIVTSRPHIAVKSHLTEVINIPLAAETLKSDISAFVDAEVYKQPQFTGSLREEVQKTLIDGANGMFLWVSLILDGLKNSTDTRPWAIRKALKILPSDLPGVYLNILRKIQTEDQTTARSILQWVVWGIRPLTMQELTIAIAVLPKHTSMSLMQDDMHTDMRKVLQLIFGPMFRIEEDKTVHLVHQSAKDFLTGTNIATEGVLSLPDWITSSAKSNLQLAVSCLAYLCFNECEQGPVPGVYVWDQNVKKNIEILQNKLPLLNYAATYWPEHARRADQYDDQDMCRTFRKLAESLQKINLAYQIFTFSSPYERFQKTDPLQITSSLGLITFAKLLLDDGADINAQGGKHGNPLQAAIVNDHKAMVRLLSARPNIQITEPIVTAAAENMSCGKAVMEVLLSARPDIQITERIVTAAAENRNCGKAVIQVLLSARPDVQITEMAVVAVAKHFDEEVIKLLLSARPDIQITEPIVIAAARNRNRSKALMEVLLSAGPDIQIIQMAVVAVANHFNEDVIKQLLSARPDIQITEMAVVAVAKRFDKEVIKQLLSARSDIQITEMALVAVAQNFGEEVIKLLLSTRPDIQITERIVTAAAENENGRAVMEVLLTARPEIRIAEPIITAAAGNWMSGKAVMEVLLSACPDIQITERIVTAAARNTYSGKAVMEVLLSARPDIQITERIVTAATRNTYSSKAVMEVLLSARPDIQITERIVTAAAENENSGKAVMEVLLSARPNIQITEPIIIAAAGNWKSGKAVMKVLLSTRPDIQITEPIVTAAAENKNSGKAVIKMLLTARPDVQITEMAVVAVAQNFDEEVIKLLLTARPDIKITEPIVTAAARNWNSGKAVMEVMLYARPDIQITEPIVKAAAKNENSGKALMEVLLSARSDIQITERIVTAAAENWNRGKAVMEVLLSARPDIQITEMAVVAVAKHFNEEVIKKLLSARPDIQITERIVTAAAENWNRGKAVMEVLLSARPDIQITEMAVVAIAKYFDAEVIKLLLSARPDIQITEMAVVAVAQNFDEDVIKLLLSARPDIQITERIASAAGENWSSGKTVMEVLVSARPDIQITERIVTAAAENWNSGKAVMEVLLSARPNIQITEMAVVAAAKHFDEEVIKLLLSARSDIQITEPIVRAAAENEKSGKAVIEMLLCARPDIQITERIVTAAALNTFSGKAVMEVLLSVRPDIQITEPIVTAAAENWNSGKALMEVLLSARPDIQITERIVTAAAENWNSGKAVMEVLLSARPDIQITEMAVVAVAKRFDEEVIKLLLSARPDILITELIATAAAGNA
ncbi:hypothetical protein BDD12DRAFT_891916 [Trichophaea hybrida]|nr:hypothetical protein BDD12DRAFT_891916 [Trichophaea hybrida]